MTTLSRNAPLYLKTYGKHKRKVEAWFSPDLRKKVFSSTSSSDLSISEPNASLLQKKRRKKPSTASRPRRRAKKRALTARKEGDGEEENVFHPPPQQNQSQRKRRRNAAKSDPKTKKPELTNTPSESEEEPAKRRKDASSGSGKSGINASYNSFEKSGNAVAPLSNVGRFVTNRRRMPLQSEVARQRKKTKKNVLMSNTTLDSSEDFAKRKGVTRAAVARWKPLLCKEDFSFLSTSCEMESAFPTVNKRDFLKESSLMGRRLPSVCKKPLLSSTPSLAYKISSKRYDPSISDITINNDDDMEDVFKSSLQTTRNVLSAEKEKVKVLVERSFDLDKKSLPSLNSGEKAQVVESINNVTAQHSKELFSHITHEEDVPAKNNPKENGMSDQANTDLGSLISSLKEKCRMSNSKVTLSRIDISSFQVQQSSDARRGTCCSVAVNMGENETGHSVEEANGHEGVSAGSAGDFAMERLGQGHCYELDYVNEVSSTQSESKHEGQSSSRLLIDEYRKDLFTKASQNKVHPTSQSKGCSSRSALHSFENALKVKCLSSQAVVVLKTFDSFHFVKCPQERPCLDSVAGASISKCNDQCNPEEQTKTVEPTRKFKLDSSAIRRRLSNEFDCSAVKLTSSSSDASPTRKDVSRRKFRETPKDKLGTGRKACVSGLSMNRWTKKESKQRQKRGLNQSLLARSGESSSHFQFGHGKKCFNAMDSWLQSTSGVGLGTPVRNESLNISSLLANFTPGNLSTHTWSRLKAALSIHKKKKAFFTPDIRRLTSNQPENGLLNCSRSPDSLMCTPHSHHLKSRLLLSVQATPLSPYSCEEDLTDAEKVYRECQQEGPITFEQCIPENKMKKIGEGTFGEVFSTFNDLQQVVALKIMPIEGSQKVNGEDQKTFGEVLHEIIISKELSSLGAREGNRTNGFIGLNNLHCVRGPYPEALLDAWDKFDEQRGSENDRPDFFGDEQLFLVLAFEFGGSDLENLNGGKLCSLVSAKSILHQVTAALAVAEQALRFEHRDLHWGNILVKTTKDKRTTYTLNGVTHSFDTKGVHVNIIDYSLSRLEIDGLTVSCDISDDEELFMGKGDYQFEVYRIMRQENNNSWSEYKPHSNVLWLHYLSDKLLHMTYKNKLSSKPMKELKKSITHFHKEVLKFQSATDVLESSRLFL